MIRKSRRGKRAKAKSLLTGTLKASIKGLSAALSTGDSPPAKSVSQIWDEEADHSSVSPFPEKEEEQKSPGGSGDTSETRGGSGDTSVRSPPTESVEVQMVDRASIRGNRSSGNLSAGSLLGFYVDMSEQDRELDNYRSEDNGKEIPPGCPFSGTPNNSKPSSRPRGGFAFNESTVTEKASNSDRRPSSINTNDRRPSRSPQGACPFGHSTTIDSQPGNIDSQRGNTNDRRPSRIPQSLLQGIPQGLLQGLFPSSKSDTIDSTASNNDRRPSRISFSKSSTIDSTASNNDSRPSISPPGACPYFHTNRTFDSEPGNSIGSQRGNSDSQLEDHVPIEDDSGRTKPQFGRISRRQRILSRQRLSVTNSIDEDNSMLDNSGRSALDNSGRSRTPMGDGSSDSCQDRRHTVGSCGVNVKNKRRSIFASNFGASGPAAGLDGRLDGLNGFPPMDTNDDTDEETTGASKPRNMSCPFFVGAADKNAALMLRRQSTISGLVKLKNTTFFQDDMNSLGEEGVPAIKVEVEYSYTTTNTEFPLRIKEEDLFGHPTPDGFVSREYGFLIPDYEKALSDLRASKGGTWFTMGRRMEGLQGNNGLLKALEEMEIIEGDEVACPDGSLQIASSILAHLANGYRAACWRNNVVYEPCPSIQIPWTKICERLGRNDFYVAPEDFMYQQRPLRGNVFEFDNMEMITPIYGTSAESLMSKLFCESNRHLRNMTGAILALARGDWQAIHISVMIAELKELTRMLGKAIPDGSAGERSIDPVEFATAFANATAPLKEGVPALSGGGCPIFVIMDHIIGRQKWDSAMGADLLMQIEWMPKNWRRFIEFLRQKRLFDHVPSHLQYLWMLMKDVYCGERGYLGKHKYRAYQYVELAGALGRTSNKGADSGASTVHMLEESRRERDPTSSADRSSYKTCPFKGTIKSVKRVSEDRITRLVTISCAKELKMQIGDHVGIVMRNNDDQIWEFACRHSLDLKSKLTTEDGTLNEEWRDRLDFDGLDHTVYNVLMCAKLSRCKTRIETEKALCDRLHPEEPRLYSFASIHPTSRETDGCVTTFDILVTRTNAGGCSAFLHEGIGCDISFGLSTAIKCYVPTITTRPLVVIAAGSGLGTYLPMLINNNLLNPKYAFLAYRTECTVPFLDTHLKEAVNYGKLKLFVELSREERTIITKDRALKRRPTTKRYIDRLLQDERELIRELAGPIDEGGMEASFFVCGNNEFFKTVRTALESIDPGIVASLVRSSRLQLEVQARGGIDGKQDARPVKLTEACFHNKMDDYWTIIDGTVYDFTEYLPWHPGGRKILHYIAGTDCTEFWKRVSHDKDRMVYSQIAAYEVGPFDPSDPDGLMEYLEFVTRAGNCVSLYKEKQDLFKNLCDSYGKVQAVWESIVGREFMELLLKLVKDRETRRKMFSRIFFAKHGFAREISNKMFGVAPIVKGHKRGKAFKVPGVRIALRAVNDDERSVLESRMIGTSDHFFTRCKRAICDSAEAISDSPPAGHQQIYSKMFYRLIMAFEELYSSLAMPMPLPSLRCWDLIRTEVVHRQTFNFRFTVNEHVVPEEYEDLAMQDLPETEEERDLWFDEVTTYLQLETHKEFRAETGISSDVIDSWFGKKEIRQLFERLDTDKDGLVARGQILDASPVDNLEREVLQSLKQEPRNRETFNFKDFLLASPELVEKNRIARVSSLLFSGLRRSASGRSVMTSK